MLNIQVIISNNKVTIIQEWKIDKVEIIWKFQTKNVGVGLPLRTAETRYS